MSGFRINWNDPGSLHALCDAINDVALPGNESVVVKYPSRPNYNIVRKSSLERIAEHDAVLVDACGNPINN